MLAICGRGPPNLAVLAGKIELSVVFIHMASFGWGWTTSTNSSIFRVISSVLCARRVDPKTGDEEEMAKDFFAMLLGDKDDLRETGAVEKKLINVRVRWDTQSENQVHDGRDRSSIGGGEGDALAPL